jgi:uncharacterized protein related to proFAR isomerase
MTIPFFYLKDKQAFVKSEGTMRLIGKPIDRCRRLSKDGIKLIHILDLDAIRGMSTNFDTYDHLTYFVNIQVEIGSKLDFIERLLRIKARVVVELPTELNIGQLQQYERLLVGKIKSDYVGNISGVHDLVLENADDECVKKFHKTGKRIMIYESNYRKLETENRKLVWGVLSLIS